MKEIGLNHNSNVLECTYRYTFVNFNPEKIAENFLELSSEQRLRIIFSLLEKKSNISNMAKELDATNPEVHRNFTRMLKAGLVEKDSDGNFYLSTYGKAICAQIPSIVFVLENGKYFENHDFGNIPVKFIHSIEELSESEHITGFVEVLEKWNQIHKNAENILNNKIEFALYAAKKKLWEIPKKVPKTSFELINFEILVKCFSYFLMNARDMILQEINKKLNLGLNVFDVNQLRVFAELNVRKRTFSCQEILELFESCYNQPYSIIGIHQSGEYEWDRSKSWLWELNELGNDVDYRGKLGRYGYKEKQGDDWFVISKRKLPIGIVKNDYVTSHDQYINQVILDRLNILEIYFNNFVELKKNIVNLLT